MKLRLTDQQKKILAGIGIVGGIGVIALFLRNRLGFNSPDLNNWTRSPKSSLYAERRDSIHELQDQYKQQTQKTQSIADAKEKREEAEKTAEWIRRKDIWETNRKLIEAAKP